MTYNSNGLRITILLIALLLIGLPLTLLAYSGCEGASTGEANGSSDEPAISADGHFVAFSSEANNLVPGDTNNSMDVFVKNTDTGETIRVSASLSGEEGDADSTDPSISADGNLVAFVSEASNLVQVDDNTCTSGNSSWNCSDVFVKNVSTGEIDRVSASTDGNQGDWFSNSPSISADGRMVAFVSYASNLVEGDTDACDDGNEPRNCADVFVKDRETGETKRVSFTPEGVEGDGDSMQPSISGDGRYVAFTSQADNFGVDDVNQASDVFLANLETGDISRISENSDGVGGNGSSYEPSVSENGRYIAFTSEASNFTEGDNGICIERAVEKNCPDIYINDFLTGSFLRASKTIDGTDNDGSSTNPSISADGRIVAYASTASNLVEGDNVSCPEEDTSGNCSDIFVSKLLLNLNTMVSVNGDGEPGDWYSYAPAISGDGQFVVYTSFAANLVSGDSDACSDGNANWNCADIFRINLNDKSVSRVSTMDATT